VPVSLEAAGAASQTLQPEQVGAGLLPATYIPLDTDVDEKTSFCDIKMEDDNS